MVGIRAAPAARNPGVVGQHWLAQSFGPPEVLLDCALCSGARIAHQKEVEKLQRKRDARYQGVSNELIIFSEEYKKLKADEVKTLMRIPQWRETFNKAAEHNLI
jgi:hypothetical protein